MIQVDDSFAIPEEELSFATSRSGGPGGQNVNKLETRVTVRLDLASPSLDEPLRARIRERLATRISRAGVLAVTSQRHRTQAANREAAVARLVELLRDALAEQAPRRPTRPGRAARARRLEAKRRQARRKRDRAAPAAGD
ncbi:MAG TPA: alternative ribosome rescue aminoacyl-tRNA hydrolase ArfB [Thermoanaerobaculia bacterium]|nr:alternative ribosome rescue aminoacyl-tRNA hydrolase ArfB [Thermoanaerobaculia bacterium]